MTTKTIDTNDDVFGFPANQRLVERLVELECLKKQDKHHSPRQVKEATAEALAADKLSADDFEALIGAGETSMETTKSQKLFSRPTGASIRVKKPGEAYSTKRYEARHVKSGLPVFDEWNDEVTRPSQHSLAINGVVLKYAARKAGIAVDWSEHDQALFTEAVETQEWASIQGAPDECKIYAPGAYKAALLDDANSGGLEAAPITFDADVITTPLLTGELLPEVDLKPISRGRRIEGASIGTPTAQWGQGDAAVGDIFDSTSQIAALDSTVMDLSCHVLIGKNFLSDTPLNIGNILTGLIGERMSYMLEAAIAEGNGTTEPQGIKGAAGTTSVSFGGVAATVAKYLELLFSTPKELRAGAGSRYAFVANETTYRRARAIATGVTGDTRLVYGMSVEDYEIFERPFKIAPALANTEILAGALNRYRLYRRLGSAVEWTVQGENLQRRNEALLTVRQRWAGRPMLASAFSVVTTAEA